MTPWSFSRFSWEGCLGAEQEAASDAPALHRSQAPTAEPTPSRLPQLRGTPVGEPPGLPAATQPVSTGQVSAIAKPQRVCKRNQARADELLPQHLPQLRSRALRFRGEEPAQKGAEKARAWVSFPKPLAPLCVSFLGNSAAEQPQTSPTRRQEQRA